MALAFQFHAAFPELDKVIELGGNSDWENSVEFNRKLENSSCFLHFIHFNRNVQPIQVHTNNWIHISIDSIQNDRAVFETDIEIVVSIHRLDLRVAVWYIRLLSKLVSSTINGNHHNTICCYKMIQAWILNRWFRVVNNYTIKTTIKRQWCVPTSPNKPVSAFCHLEGHRIIMKNEHPMKQALKRLIIKQEHHKLCLKRIKFPQLILERSNEMSLHRQLLVCFLFGSSVLDCTAQSEDIEDNSIPQWSNDRPIIGKFLQGTQLRSVWGTDATGLSKNRNIIARAQ